MINPFQALLILRRILPREAADPRAFRPAPPIALSVPLPSHVQLDSRLTEERAELVASNGLLDQNERLRAAIVAEEKEKFESEKVGLGLAWH